MIQFFRKHGFVHDQLPAILWACFIFIASSISNVTLPEFGLVPADKAVHLLVYFVLCAFFHRALTYQVRFPMVAKWSLLLSVLFAILFGASDEFHQSFVPNRDASVLDLAADSVGALLFVAYVLLRLRREPDPP